MQGRIMSKRSSSSKLFFYDLLGAGAGTAKVQVMADARYLITVSFLFPYSYLIFHYDFSIVISLGMQCLWQIIFLLVLIFFLINFFFGKLFMQPCGAWTYVFFLHLTLISGGAIWDAAHWHLSILVEEPLF